MLFNIIEKKALVCYHLHSYIKALLEKGEIIISRKDRKGRVLKPGESERKDGRYQYRYTNIIGKRKTIYARTLDELRKKEKEAILSGAIDQRDSDNSVMYYLRLYVNTRPIKESTREQYLGNLKVLAQTPFVNRPASKIKVIDAKRFLIEFKEAHGLKNSTISNYKGMFRGAFDIAYEDEVVLRNPFAFKSSSLYNAEETSKKNIALTREQQRDFMTFVKESKKCSKYYNEIMIMLGTGMRVGELCGLTKDEIDFDNDRIEVKHQKAINSHDLVSPKTESSYRFIPISDIVRDCLLDVLEKRSTRKIINMSRDKQFLFLTNVGNPYSRCIVLDHLERCIDVYKKTYPDSSLPYFTPHSLRHTFCTNMVAAGALPKDLQFIMGHAKLEMTMDYYTHYNWDMLGNETKEAINA